MMILSRIDRYIAAHILSAFLVVLLVVVGLMGLSILLEELGDVGPRYQTSDAITHVLLSLPGVTYQLMPLCALVGTLIGLGVLASNSELTIMRASGLSMSALIRSILKPVGLIALCALVLGEYGVPQAQQLAQNLKAIAKSAGGRIETGSGAWYREGNAFVHVTAVASNGDLIGITEHQFDDEHRLQQTRKADRAIFNPEAERWELLNLRATKLDPLSGALQTQAAERAPWQTELDRKLLGVLLVKPSDLPISGLVTYSDYLEQQGVNASSYRLAFWSKLLQPLSVFTLVLIGAAFIFGPLRSVTSGQRVLTGVVIGLVFKFSQDLAAPSSQLLGFAPVLAASLPILIGLALAAYMLSRVR